MSTREIFTKQWELLRKYGERTIEIANEQAAWDYRITSQEFSVEETFYHTIKAIFEDAGNYFLEDSTPFTKSNNRNEDMNRAINRMIKAIKNLDEKSFTEGYIERWGREIPKWEMITQNLLHAMGHFGQIRERVGISRRK